MRNTAIHALAKFATACQVAPLLVIGAAVMILAGLGLAWVLVTSLPLSFAVCAGTFGIGAALMLAGLDASLRNGALLHYLSPESRRALDTTPLLEVLASSVRLHKPLASHFERMHRQSMKTMGGMLEVFSRITWLENIDADKQDAALLAGPLAPALYHRHGWVGMLPAPLQERYGGANRPRAAAPASLMPEVTACLRRRLPGMSVGDHLRFRALFMQATVGDSADDSADDGPEPWREERKALRGTTTKDAQLMLEDELAARDTHFGVLRQTLRGEAQLMATVVPALVQKKLAARSAVTRLPCVGNAAVLCGILGAVARSRRLRSKSPRALVAVAIVLAALWQWLLLRGACPKVVGMAQKLPWVGRSVALRLLPPHRSLQWRGPGDA